MTWWSWTAARVLGAVLLPAGSLAQSAGPAEAQAMQAGTAALQRGDLPAAMAAFRNAVQLAPSSAEAHLGLGLVELREGAAQEAENSLQRATTLNPRLAGAHMFLGIDLYQQRRYPDAINALQQELGLDGKNLEALTWMGIVQLGAGHPEQATGPLDEAVQLAPHNPELLYYRARAHSLTAEATFHQLYTEAPDSALVHRALAESLAGTGQPEKAIAEYQLALAKEPKNADLYEALGNEDQKLSRFDAAREAYTKALTLNPHSGASLYNLGKIDVEAGRAESGVKLLDRSEAQEASPAAAAYYLGFGFAQMGQNAKAAEWLEKSLTAEPTPFIEQGALFQLTRVYQRLGRKQESEAALARLKRLKSDASKADNQAISGAGTASSAGQSTAAPQGPLQ